MVKGIYVIGNGVDVGANTIFKRLYKFKDTSIGEVAIIERWIADPRTMESKIQRVQPHQYGRESGISLLEQTLL